MRIQVISCYGISPVPGSDEYDIIRAQRLSLTR